MPGPSVATALHLQFKQVDQRPWHPLDPIIGLSQLHKSVDPKLAVGDAALASPKMISAAAQRLANSLQPSRTSDAEDTMRGAGAVLKAAMAQLTLEKAEVVARMEQSVAQSIIARSNRNFRLNSLGVFDASINEARSQSMHRVELHKGLSTISTRGPPSQKEVRRAHQTETVQMRLEKMYQRVLKSIEDTNRGKHHGSHATRGAHRHTPHPVLLPADSLTAPNAVVGVAGASFSKPSPADPIQRCASTVPMLGKSPTLSRSVSKQASSKVGKKTGRNSNPSGGPAGLQSHGSGMLGRSGQPVSVLQKMDWSKLSLPSEVLEAQVEHLVAKAQEHLSRYHKLVKDEQTRLLVAMGIDPSTMSHGTEALDAEMCAHALVEAKLSARGPSEDQVVVTGVHVLKDISVALLAAKTLPDIIKLAMQHVVSMELEYRALVGDLPGRMHSRDHRSGLGQRSLRSSRAVSPHYDGSKSKHSNSNLGATTRPEHHHRHHHTRRQSDPLCDHPADSEQGVGSGSSSGEDGSRSDGSDVMDDSSAAGSETGGHGDHSRGSSMARSQHGGARKAAAAAAAAAVAAALKHENQVKEAQLALKEAQVAAQKAKQALLAESSEESEKREEVVVVSTAPSLLMHPARMKLFMVALDAAGRDNTFGAGTGTDGPTEVTPLVKLRNKDPSILLQARLARIWKLLLFPVTDRCDMVMHYTGIEMAFKIEGAVTQWEKCAAAVIARELWLGQLMIFKTAVEAEDVQRISIEKLQGVCCTLLRLTRYAAAQAAVLMSTSGGVLTYQGLPYPGFAAVSKEHLIQFFELVRDVSIKSGILE